MSSIRGGARGEEEPKPLKKKDKKNVRRKDFPDSKDNNPDRKGTGETLKKNVLFLKNQNH